MSNKIDLINIIKFLVVVGGVMTYINMCNENNHLQAVAYVKSYELNICNYKLK